MRRYRLFVATLGFAVLAASGQAQVPAQVAPSSQPAVPAISAEPGSSQPEEKTAPADAAFPPLFDFSESDVKFDVQRLMNLLRDSRHEGWVLAAYPDPKTSRPLIGAGFSLDVAATDHPQRDPLNPNNFVEPSSEQLWQAAGLAPERLRRILDQYDRNLNSWSKKKFRRKIRTHSLAPQITDEEATRLLRISVIEAIHNARAYCRDFDQLTAAQQMALSQLVFQMGVNLEEFVQFRAAVNGDAPLDAAPQPGDGGEDAHWKTVQQTLIGSQWARQYSARAASVIAMFDPEYARDPEDAEREVRAILRPAVVHRRRGRSAGSLRVASLSRRGRVHHPKAASRAKRKRV